MSIYANLVQIPEFKRLLKSIDNFQNRDRFKSLAILSLYRGEGKTTFAAGLAVGFAKNLGKRALFFDATSKKTTQTDLLNVDSLTVMNLSSVSTDDDDIQEWRVTDFLTSLQPSFDIIVVDTQAIKENNIDSTKLDPILLSESINRSILLTSKLSLQDEELTTLKKELARFRISLLGMVHNPWI